MERGNNSIASRVSNRRKRGLLFAFGGGGASSQQKDDDEKCTTPTPPPSSRPRSTRRKLLLGEDNYTQEDIEIIKQTFGHCQHHGTGNPLAKRAPSSPQAHYAVTNLAAIIQAGHVGKRSGATSNSNPSLKTERGMDGSFWACRLRLAGSYGWTGLVLKEDAKTDKPLPIQDVEYFLVESIDEMEVLKSQLTKKQWKEVQERVITVMQLAERARSGDAGGV